MGHLAGTRTARELEGAPLQKRLLDVPAMSEDPNSRTIRLNGLVFEPGFDRRKKQKPTVFSESKEEKDRLTIVFC